MKATRLLLATIIVATTIAGCKENAQYDATGIFEATEVTVAAKMAGEIQSFNIEEGQQMQAGKVFGTIDATQLQLKKQQLESTSRQLTASRQQLEAGRKANNSRVLDLTQQVAAIQQQIVHQQRERQRFTELLRDGAATQKQVDDITSQIAVLQRQKAATREQIASANAALRQQNAGLEAQMQGVDAQNGGISSQQSQLNDQIANTRITSPINGTVLEKYVERGEYAAPGKPLFKVADISVMYLRAYVTSHQLQKIHIGQQVQVLCDYGNNDGPSYQGTISWIAAKSEFTPKTIVTDDERADLVYAVKIRVKNDGHIKMGMYGKVKFIK